MSEFRRHATRLQAHRIRLPEEGETPFLPTSRLRASLWQADLASIALLVSFVIFISVSERAFNPGFSQNGLLLTGIFIALVPGIVWLAFFYRRDRLEPEPKGMVVQQFVLGGLLASALGVPLVEGVFDIPQWLSSGPVWAQLLGGFLIVGFVQSFLVYAAVRFTVYNSSEFDELTDGVIYATAAGLGFATVLNIQFVVASGGVNLGSGALRIVLTALAHASFAGIIGYFLGREKFEGHPLWWMPMGVALAAGLNSLFFFFRGLMAQGAGDVGAWAGLVMATGLATGVTWLLSYLMRRDLLLLLDPEYE
jgi:RsiW-degrading membrane proteinase PrsW (M82 family)